MKGNGLRRCSVECMDKKKACNQIDCRLWIEYEEDYNCCLVSIFENGPMTLRQIGDRIGVSFARVKQIESEALKKMKKHTLISDC